MSILLRRCDSPQQSDNEALREHCRDLLKKSNAVLIAHYYVDGELQDLAEETGGCVSDSLEMARFGRDHPADTLVVAGVRFMAETAKILSYKKRILTLSREATCSLDEGCKPDEFKLFCNQYEDHTVVCYTNTSAAVKSMCDWTVTSSIAMPVIQHLHSQNKNIIFAPDWHLGRNISVRTGIKMVLWHASCIVHDEFQASELKKIKDEDSSVKILVHPESPTAVVALADCVGSTTQLLRFARETEAKKMIVATDMGLLHKMRAQNPDKVFTPGPTSRDGRPCTVCAHCPWMAMNSLSLLAKALETGQPEVFLDEEIANRAIVPIERMLCFGREIGVISR
ncbi:MULTISPECIES: quinolinate synthase NadA [Candidatus Ichthyocystis]|uniref:Quinolinate synthase n=1 Tax=Candidatus Ichthyocystis hellenicum TaxID=1561003 RepID=A0A0S4M7S2_9BURK|nr:MULTISPECIES: quinolinate synthase NadA [Ichthyocystis]CUT17444.1 Quinolinate synthase [Candidatus Ichthyocystis hellenicum]